MGRRTKRLLAELQSNCYGRNFSLPSVCYTSASFHKREMKKVLGRGWHCLGRQDEIPTRGDYFATRLLNESVIVVRSGTDEISVMSNVCRHRAMPVAQGVGNVVMFRCPYHAWTYNLDGRLRSAPLLHEKPGADCSLPRFRSENWAGFVFATLDPDAPTLNELLADLHCTIENYDVQDMHHIASFNEVWDCNWKSLVENFMDGYHLSVVHPDTLRPLTPTSLCRQMTNGENFTSYIANYAAAAPVRNNHSPKLTDDEKRQSRLLCVFPSLVVSVSPDTVVYLALQPKGTDQVAVKWGLASYESDLPEEEKKQRIEKWRAINHEDHEILKNLWYGHQSNLHHGGVLGPSNLEGTVSDFHDYLIRKMA